MTGEGGTGSGTTRTKKFLVRYRNIFIFLGVILLGQLVLALKLLINDMDTYGPPLPRAADTAHKNVHKEGLKAFKMEHLGVTLLSGENTNGANLSQSNVVAPCQITGKDAISAIRRATTEYCKEYLTNMTCIIATDTLYPKRLPRFCNAKDTTYMKHVGCYRDDKSKRLLKGSYSLFKDTNSPQTCVDACLQSGFQHAGVQYSVECFCGNLKSVPVISDEALCDMKCPFAHNENVTCGGYFVMNVYETGVGRESEVSQAIDLRQSSEDLPLGSSQNVQTSRIIFFLTLNGRALRQVIRLIKSLFHERHYFYVHVDARQDYLFRELLGIGYKLPNNFRFMRERLSTIWGGASLLKVLLYGMNDIVENGSDWGWSWDYVINLSESDFPLKTVSQLERFLTLNKGKNFLKSHGRDVQNFILKQGLDKTFVECEHRMWRIGDRKLPAGIVMDGGSDWVALHKDFVEYVVRTEDDLVNGLLKIFDHTLLPAESFFHIVLKNCALCHTFVDNNLHVTNWKRKLGCKCQYKSIVDWCGCSPNDFRLSDWSRLLETEAKMLFFGRKFEAFVNQGVINQLEGHLYPYRSESNYPTRNSYWQSIYHHHDLTPKPDDALLTLASSLARLAVKSLQLLEPSKEKTTNPAYISTKVQELSVFVQHDRVAGILTHFDLFFGNVRLLSAETWFKLQNFVSFEPWSLEIDKYHAKIQHLQVGSEYDQKEQVFRNFGGSLGPLSEPTLAYHVYADSNLNLTFVWINSLQSVQAVQNFTIEIGITANFAKPALKMPLIPGNWTVKILTDSGHLVAHSIFLVAVAEYYHGKPISLTQNKILNGVALNRHSGSMEDESENELWTPAVLHSRIDTQTTNFYAFQDICLQHLETQWLSIIDTEGQLNTMTDMSTFLNLKNCTDTSWSSKFPDPKSSITGIDPKTGTLLP